MAKNLAAFDGSKTYLNMSAASRSGKTPAPCVSSGVSCGSTSLLVTPFSADARGDDPGEKGGCNLFIDVFGISFNPFVSLIRFWTDRGRFLVVL